MSSSNFFIMKFGGKNFERIDGTTFDVGRFLTSGRDQKVFVREDYGLVFKFPRFLNKLSNNKLSFAKRLAEDGKGKMPEFTLGVFATRVLSTLEATGRVNMPAEWAVQECIKPEDEGEEPRIGFWQTFYRGKLSQTYIPHALPGNSLEAEDERPFFSVGSNKNIFLDWGTFLRETFDSLDRDYSMQNLDRLCKNIQDWGKSQK